MIEILIDDVTLDGMRRLKVLSDAPILHEPPFFVAGVDRQFREWKDDALGLHYLEATWPCREAILLRCEGWIGPRPVVLWKLKPGERVSEVVTNVMVLHHEAFGCFPDYAFMWKLPKTIEDGFEVADVMFFAADWVPPGCIAVCNGG
ncbi:MAG: hypothetical protein EHM40_11100 [Chloroflexi bacterium]|nr:MAG: hypothetical protein EHM40_11100 [Chloroflexota bacterium]